MQRFFSPGFDPSDPTAGVALFGNSYPVAVVVAGAVVTTCVALVVIGGLKRIAKVSMVVVPFMAFPNLIALVFLSPVVVRVTRDFLDRQKKG